ncbi:MAG: PAS domain S-box protein [Dehalococcoidia bacterium]|nr:PAS domain S-box protein [Dehalococcoidia bacterium]
MKDSDQSKQELVNELKRMRQRIAELEAAEAEHKRTEEKLRQSEERYRTIVEEMEEGYYETDLAGNYTFFNDAMRKESGYTRKELMGMNYRVYTPEEDVKRVYKTFNDIYRTGKPRRWYPMVNIRKDGARIFVEDTIFLLHNTAGEKIGFRGISRNVTERKQAGEALSQSEEKYRTILHEMDEGYYEVDLAGNYTFFNDVVCTRLGYTRKELMGLNYQFYTPEEDVKSVYRIYNEVYRTGKPRRWYPMVNIAKDGTRTFVENSILPIRDAEGHIAGFRGISRDVSERKRIEEERRQLEQKAQLASRLASVGEMASGIAHEINNPLTGVIGYAQLLLQEDLPDNIRKDLETINDGAQRVANVVQRLLAFARQTKPQRTYVNINEVLATTLDLRGYHLQTSNIKVTKQLAPDLPLTVADAGQLQQVFLNLIVNAETEMNLARGHGKLTVKTQRINQTIRISFNDDGRGISDENLERIFDPFFTTRQVGQGTGLGLSVCYGIVSEHNGRIFAESKQGKGATFIVELPITTKDKQLEFPETAAPEQRKATGAKILVVDDEPVVREFISKVLTEEGHQVDTVDNAEDALEMVRGKTYRIILLDIKMPGMSGIELFKRFQKMTPSLARKVVFVTGDVMGARTTAFLSKANSPYITKPFTAGQLNIEINRLFVEGR